MSPPPPSSPLFPYTTLFRSVKSKVLRVTDTAVILDVGFKSEGAVPIDEFKDAHALKEGDEIEVFLEHLRSEEHTSELQSLTNLVCRLLLEKKKKRIS